ncbi:unnamed protein product [Vicia faba]|uniref:Pentatricopeptide repeat-containing protein n=1 Tax=Vicia faba TaxID=3906 RepID=A0AAV0ZV89_VICFA|nr:unnamed protein product [Vicia faba]
MENSVSSLSLHFPLNHKPNIFQLFNFKPSSQTPTTHPRNLPKFTITKKKFAEEDAFPSSLPLHSKNPLSIYKDIKNFARQNKLKEALTILDYVDQQGDALKLFDELPVESSVYPWNALLRGTVVSGGRKKQYIDVVKTYSKMRELGVELNVYSFSSVIKSFAAAPALYQGLKTHALLIKNGLVDSDILRTCLIDLYFKCGKVRLARSVFEEIPEMERDVVVWGAMLSGFSHNRLHKEVLEYVKWMVDEGIYPNSVIMMIVMPVIGEICERRLGREVHAYVVKTKSYSERVPIQSALIDMYCKCGDLGSARRVFYNSPERNVVCWTALMSGYASDGRLEQALRSIIWMQQEGFRPDVVTVATALPVCAQLRALEEGKQIHAYALKHWFLPNVSVSSSLMVMYSKCGIVEYSERLFEGMEHRNVISWTVMINSYIENGYLYEAIDVIRSMQLSRNRPDLIAMSRMLSVCGGLKLLKLGKEIHGQILKRDFASVHFISAELINMYGTFGDVDKAILVFIAVPVKGSMTWTALIRAYGDNEFYQGAIDLFNQMRSNGFSPNHFTFGVILSICERAGFVNDANKIFNLMPKYEIEASKEHFDVMVRLLTRYGQLKKAQRFVQMSSFL